jgi:hypothetical protein
MNLAQTDGPTSGDILGQRSGEHLVDILLALRDGNSFCKTAMPRREDIVSCIDVTIMDRSAHKTLQTSRNAGRGQAALRGRLSLAGLKASVSRGEIA